MAHVLLGNKTLLCFMSYCVKVQSISMLLLNIDAKKLSLRAFQVKVKKIKIKFCWESSMV